MRFLITSLLAISAWPLCATPIVSMLPQSQSMVLGAMDVFAITVDGMVAGGPPSIGAFDINVSFDPTLLNLKDWSWAGGLDLFNLGSIRSVLFGPGSVDAFEVSLESVDDLHTYQNDLVLLGVLQFEAIGIGVSPISIQVNGLSDANGNALSFAVVGGSIDVISDAASVPEPSTIALILPVLLIIFTIHSNRQSEDTSGLPTSMGRPGFMRFVVLSIVLGCGAIQAETTCFEFAGEVSRLYPPDPANPSFPFQKYSQISSGLRAVQLGDRVIGKYVYNNAKPGSLVLNPNTSYTYHVTPVVDGAFIDVTIPGKTHGRTLIDGEIRHFTNSSSAPDTHKAFGVVFDFDPSDAVSPYYQFGANLSFGRGTLQPGATIPDPVLTADSLLYIVPYSRTSARILQTTQSLGTVDLQAKITELHPCVAQLFDPISELLEGNTITKNLSQLSRGGRVVSGVTADGVSQVVVKVRASQTAIVRAKLQTCSGSSPSSDTCTDVDNDATGFGGIYDLFNSPEPSVLFSRTRNAVRPRIDSGLMPQLAPGAANQSQYTAYLVYRAPDNFIRQLSNDAVTAERTIHLRLDISDQGSTTVSFTPIKIVRPLVIPFWRQVREIETLRQPPTGWTVWEQRYPGSLENLPKGFVNDIPRVLVEQTDAMLTEFRLLRDVASAQADFVAYSRAGVAVRAMSLRTETGPRTYGQGFVHKLVSLGSPHEGSELLSIIKSLPFWCQPAVAAWQRNNVDTLGPASPFLQSVTGRGVPVYPVAAELSLTQLIRNSFILNFLGFACKLPIPPSAVFGTNAHDGVVRVSSALASHLFSQPQGETIVGRSHDPGIVQPDIFGRYSDGTSVDNGVLSGIVRRALEMPVEVFGRL